MEKKIVIWLTEKFDSNVAKLKISNYASSLSLNATAYANVDDGVIYRLMSSQNSTTLTLVSIKK